MKRFTFVDGESAKITKHVDCPLNDLDLGPYTEEAQSEGYRNQLLYDLVGVINHSGKASGGHYTLHMKCEGGNWYNFNDSSVTPIVARDVVSSSAYCLVYCQKARLSSLIGMQVSTGPAIMAEVSAEEVESNADGSDDEVEMVELSTTISNTMDISDSLRSGVKTTSNAIKRSKQKSTRDKLESKKRRTEKGKLLKSDQNIFFEKVRLHGMDWTTVGLEMGATSKACKKFWDKLKQGHKNSLLQPFIQKNFDSFERSVIKHGLDWAKVARDIDVTKTSCEYYYSKLNKIDKADLVADMSSEEE